MNVWLGFHCTYDGCWVYKTVEEVFDCDVKAYLWQEDDNFAETHDKDYEWREFTAYEVK